MWPIANNIYLTIYIKKSLESRYFRETYTLHFLLLSAMDANNLSAELIKLKGQTCIDARDAEDAAISRQYICLKYI